MVSERRLVKRSSSQKQALTELDLSSIPSFREKKFKKNAISKNAVSSKHGSGGSSHVMGKKKPDQPEHVSPTFAMDRKRLPGRKESSSCSLRRRRSADAPSRSNPVKQYNVRKQPNNHHSPRAFSLFTLQEYLHERSHVDGAASPATYMDTKGFEECDMYMESAHCLHQDDEGMDSMPLLPSNLQCNYTRKPRKIAPPNYHDKSSVRSKYHCNRAGCNLKCRGEFHHTECSTEEELVGDNNDGKNEALSIKGYHGCVPWQSLSSVTPKCNKKKMIMELAGKSFACGGFQVARRHNRMHAYNGRINDAHMMRPRRETQWDSLSSNFGSESAPLLSESEAHDAFLHSRCYPGCNSVPRLLRQKMQLADGANMEVKQCSTNPDEIGVVRAKMRHGRNQMKYKKSSRCRGKLRELSNDCKSHSNQSDSGRENAHGHSKTNREQHRSLSEKYRPCAFEEMVGQSMISQALANAAYKGKIAPVYLFQGPRGTGKTCAAKVFAAAVNCLSKERTSKTTMPCQSCKHCAESRAATKSSNIRVVDANNGIDDMKSLSKFIFMTSRQSKYKVLIIDECHMLSKEAWSLFLNIIDRPPTHVVFILITTDTEQLPRMVISKCQKFLFTKIKDADILSRLWRLCDLEGIDVDGNALQLIASRADGSLFDAETTLDQLTNLGQKITSGLVREMVGLVADEKLVELLNAAMKGDSVNTVRCIRQLMETGIEPLALMSQLAALITDLLAGHPPAISSLSSTSSFLSQPLGKMELEKLRQALRILSEAEKQLRSCNNKTTWLTAAVLQFCPPDSVFHVESYNHEAAQSSSMGTSLTQSPNALLDTSERETAEMPCYGTNTANVKPPWDSGQNWQDNVAEEVEGQQERPCFGTSNMERAESRIDISSTQINLHNKKDKFDSALDVVAAYRQSPSVHRKDSRVECESSVRKISILAESTSFEYESSKNNSTQVAPSPSSMDDIWRKVLEGSVLTDILSGQNKLISLSVSEAYAIAHLEFHLLEDKKKADNVKGSIVEAFQMALGCPVDVQFSLAPATKAVNGDFRGSHNGVTSESIQITQKKNRRRKPRKRLSRARCNEGAMSGSYYSKRQSWHNPSHSHRFLDNSAPTNGHHITRGTSSDESFTEWTRMYKPRPKTQALQKTSTRSMRAESHGQADHREIEHQKHKFSPPCALSGSHNGIGHVGESGDYNSPDLFYGASLRVERDSSNYQSFEYELEYDQSNMTPAFRTGFLCWKATAKKSGHALKIRHRKGRRRDVPFAGCVPCTN